MTQRVRLILDFGGLDGLEAYVEKLRAAGLAKKSAWPAHADYKDFRDAMGGISRAHTYKLVDGGELPGIDESVARHPAGKKLGGPQP